MLECNLSPASIKKHLKRQFGPLMSGVTFFTSRNVTFLTVEVTWAQKCFKPSRAENEGAKRDVDKNSKIHLPRRLKLF